MAEGGSEPAGVAALAVRGVAWNVAGTAAGQVLRLAANIVVARLLAPEDFAVAGVALALISVFQVVTIEGFAQALVRRKVLQPITIDSVFWPLIGGAAAVAGLVVLLVPVLTSFYSRPALTGVLPVLALGIVFGMAGAVPRALLQREFKFRAINLADLMAAIVTASGGVGLAVAGFGYHALIAPVVAGYLARSLVLFWTARYRPSLRFAWSELVSVSRFGLSQLGTNILGVINDNADYLLMSRVWPAASFGQYYFSFERSRQPFQLLYPQISAALFPSFAKIQESSARLRAAYLNVTQAFSLIMFPLHVLLIVLADPLVPWIFGRQWEPAIPIFQIFASFTFVRSFTVTVPSMLLALDRAHLALAFNVFRTVVTLPVLLLLASREAGVLTTAVVLLAIWTAQAPVFVGMLLRLIDLPLREVWLRMRRVLLSTLLMAAVAWGVRLTARRNDWSDWLDVSICTVLAGTVFGLLNRAELLRYARDIPKHLRPSADSPRTPAPRNGQ